MIRLLLFRLQALRGAVSLYRALDWRERNAIYVCWFSLETADERDRFRRALRQAVFDAWGAARGKRHVLDPSRSETLTDEEAALIGTTRVPSEHDDDYGDDDRSEKR